MRRIMLITLLALVLPTAGLASSFIAFISTVIQGGLITSTTTTGGFSSPGSFSISFRESTITMTIRGAILSSGCAGLIGMCTFTTGGTLTVTRNRDGLTQFEDKLLAGAKVTVDEGRATILASLAPGGTPHVDNGTVEFRFTFDAANRRVTGGTGTTFGRMLD